MDFSLDESLQTVRDLAGQILGDLSTPQRLTNLDGWFDREAWDRLADAGLLGIALPEQVGGAGLGFLGAHMLIEAAGTVAAQVPAVETLVLGALPLATFGGTQHAQLLAQVIAGRTLLTAALTEDPPADLLDPRTTATRTDEGWELSGVKTPVPIAPLADFALVSATTGDGIGVWLVDLRHDSVQVRDQEVVSTQPHGEVVLDRTPVPADALLGSPDGLVLTWLLEHGAAALASLAAGACSGALRLAADYTSSREQFGRPVATFQAVAHRVADAYIDVEAATLTSLQAAWRLTEGLDAADEVAIAKWWAAEAGHRVLHAAHHVHGGVGVDREYPLHRYFGLVKHTEFQLGNATTQLLRIGASMAAEPA